MSRYQEYVGIGLCGFEFIDESGREHACYLENGHDGKKHYCDCGAELDAEKAEESSDEEA